MPKPVVQVEYAKRPPRCHVVDGAPTLPSAPEREPEFPPRFSDTEIAHLQQVLAGHCLKLQDRVAILDTLRPAPETTPGEVIHWRTQFDTKYAALYFPWLKVPDPLRLEGLLRVIPPSGHVAGVYARGDLAEGVHKPPANEALAAVQDVLVQVNDIIHGEFNEHHINAIRVYNGRGVRIGGARTLSNEPEWRYVNVRRLLIMIEEAIEERMQRIVFEPNNPALWRDVDRVVRTFLDGLWRQGMLDGATAQEAYDVRCDEETNPPHETDQGRMTCVIGVLPPWPAEFVTVRIGITQDSVTVVE
jgi:phage tail sheath protein FI